MGKELFKTTCTFERAGGTVSITEANVIISVRHGFSNKETTVARSSITGIDASVPIIGAATLTIHRAGSDVVVHTLTRKAIEQIKALLQ